MNLFKRLFKIGEAEAHSALEKLENPIKMTEQGIRDLKKQLDDSLKAMAEVKALAISARNESEKQANTAKDYEKKAMLLLQRAQKGEMDAAEADRLASEALIKKEECVNLATEAAKNRDAFDQKVAQLEVNIKKLRSNISSWENELKTLKARVKVSEATKNLNKQLAQIDSSNTVSMLERMKEKVSKDEALAEAYGDIAHESRSVDEEIESALAGSEKAKASDDLAALKERLGMTGLPGPADQA